MSQDIKHFAELAGLNIEQFDLLETALTHSSWAYEHSSNKKVDNERLEFLGDAVLQLSVSSALFALQPALPEGRMTKVRALLVCENTLAKLAESLNLGEYLLLGHGEDMTGGRHKPSNLANAMEAVMGALYLDKGFEAAKSWINEKLAPYLALAEKGKLRYDYKSSLLETVQAYPEPHHLSFQIIKEEGPVHNRIFTAEICLDGISLAIGEGSSKKEAEQHASERALMLIEADKEA